ncbi:RagB/SusD family nutrient uptake outer membrane protein [Prevotella sp. A2931]|uniref:RagB/SusD family nutrient uptake outer membrane protein n=1 Tax=Prevotella illustrans TaxID=2800387 RepID=A0ABS3M410_9BACT|nr:MULTISPECIES: RagB/SusD family nutrient uptake outer membrane protein [Prevotella]MBO1362856.1 RagB/SusD family nutrient uptake outer membrane protein [Prevotella illustrans]PTL25923.1 RagB/SusD family nutrient uptake outer membrane protein [Prevotella sp. oral taxon 820]
MKNIFKYTCLAMSVALLASCNDFLDVQPKGQLEQDKMFQDLTGFEDAMFGIYGKMATGDLYGENLSWGLVDEIGQQFGYDNIQELAYHFNHYDYRYQQARSAIDKIWSNQYQAISYINNVLEHADRANFAPTEIRWMKGECYGLRAFLHFDIARLFCNDYTRSDAATQGLPYATTFDLKNKPKYTLFETYRLILRDLDTADSLLVDDNDISFDGDYQRDYRKGRVMLFNKYVVKATKARVYYAMGNYTEAARYAREVIAANNLFQLNTGTTIDRVMRFPAEKEIIFGLYNNSKADALRSAFLRTTGRGNFVEARRDLRELYETASFTALSSDLRYSAFFRENASGSTYTFSFVRLLQNDAEVSSKALKGFVLISLPEMYYILSESVYDGNPTEAVSLLNQVRRSRGLTAVDPAKVATKDLFIQEMARERTREFPGMGQTFYALKHYNRSFTDFRNVNTYQPSDEIFNLPWPDREIEYGNK